MSNTPETDFMENAPTLGESTVVADLARKLERERDEARNKTEDLLITNAELAELAWKWRECAERLAEQLGWWAGPSLQIGGHQESKIALQEFERLKEASK